MDEKQSKAAKIALALVLGGFAVGVFLSSVIWTIIILATT